MDSKPTSERAHTFHWQDPGPALAVSRHLSGLEYLQGVMKGQFPPPPFPHVLGLLPQEVSAGKVVFSLEPAEFHYNILGSVHGGVTASLCDTAMGCAVHTMLPAGTGYTTLDLQVRFVRPLLTTTGRILCVGTTVHVGRRSATAEARVTDAHGKLYAHATTSCMVFAPERGG